MRQGPPTPKYFSSPETCVEIISQYLARQNWLILASYYYLENSGISFEDLISGRFFIREKRPGKSGSGFWRYRHPFALGYHYQNHYTTDKETVVEVAIEIDQGEGMVQRGQSAFKLIETEFGYQILPEILDWKDLDRFVNFASLNELLDLNEFRFPTPPPSLVE